MLVNGHIGATVALATEELIEIERLLACRTTPIW